MSSPVGVSRNPFLDGAAMRAELDRVLASAEFSGSERRTRLLRYLVDRAIAGETVKEYTIGVDVFEKPADYDPRLDPSVRVEMGRVRTKLVDYYNGAGKSSALRLEFPKRSYTPTLISSARPALGPEPHSPPLGHAKRISKWVPIGATLALLTASLFVWRYFGRQTEINSVAVLPFANLTGDPHNDYIADGVSEQLTDALAHASALRVVARTSAFQFKGKSADIREIGRKLNADAVIEGSIGSVDGKLRLTVQVNRSRDGYHIFSRALEGAWSEVGRLESEIVAPVLASLQPRAVIAKRAPPDPEAYDLFLKARAFRGEGTRAASDQAIALLYQAINRDPGYADAYAALAGVYAADALSLVTDPVEYAKQAKAAAVKALELDPNSAPAYSAVGYVDSLVFLDWKGGERELRKAIALMPQNAAAHNRLGSVLIDQGRFSEAIPELQKAADLDPLITAPRVTVGLAYFMSRNYDEALRRFTEVRDLHPEAFIVHAFIGLAWEGKQQFDRAMEEYKMVEAKSPATSRAFIAHLLAVTGKRAESLAILDKMEHPTDELPNAFDIAVVYAGLGEKESAFQWLERAYEHRIVWFLKVHPFLDPLRDDPRFGVLLRKAGLD